MQPKEKQTHFRGERGKRKKKKNSFFRYATVRGRYATVSLRSVQLYEIFTGIPDSLH